jgi:trimethylguanosine synthase
LGAESVERLELSSSECPWGSKYQWYWDNRTNFFSRWYDDNGNQLIECDVTGIFTVKPEAVANDIANHLIGDVVLDAFAGVGGVSIALARSGKTVIAVEKDANRAKMLKHNAFVYGVEDRICIVSEDVFSIYQDLEFDSIYLDPPWGGPSYKGKESFQMRHFRVGHRDVVKRMRQLLQFSLESEKSVGFTVPNNFDFPEFSTFCRKICESPNMRSSPQHMSLRWGRIDHRVLFMTVFMNSSRNASTVAN